MTKEEFTKLFAENPNDDNVMTEINRLYDEESRLTADFAKADAERTQYKSQLDEANKRYRERFLSGKNDPDEDKDDNKTVTIESLFRNN